MISILGTLPFLATLWLLVVLGATVLEESGAKIAAALKGIPAARSMPPARHPRRRLPVPQSKRFETRWRAAA